MKIIHTSDIHLDASFASSGMTPALGRSRRQSLRAVLRAILTRAAEWPADAVLIAGDLFEQDRISQDTVAFLRSEFERIRPIPIFIAPGNHDPYTPASPYALEAWPANVSIFTAPEWQAIQLMQCPLTVHGFGFDGPEVSCNPFGTLDPPRDGRVHIALGHGSERGHQPPGKASYAPFEAASACPESLHYLALGHFHSPTQLEGPFATSAWYAGAPEGHSFNETGMRHYLEIEIEGPESPETQRPVVTVRPVESAQSIYETHTVDCTDISNSQQLIDHILKWKKPDGPAQLLRTTLTGIASLPLDQELASVRETLAASFAFIDIVDETLPAEEFDDLARENTSLGMFVRRISAEIEDAPDEALRRKLLRARDLGVAAYRGKEIPVTDLEF